MTYKYERKKRDGWKASNVLSCICERYIFFAHEKFIQPLNYMVRFFCTLYNDDDGEYGTEKKEVKPTKMLWETSFHSSYTSLLHNNFLGCMATFSFKKKPFKFSSLPFEWN